MFKNIGEKIKTLTTIVTIIGMVFALLSGLFIILSDIFNDFVYSLICGIAVIIIGVCGSWISGFFLYGFGELIDRTASIDKKLSVLLRRSNEKKRKETPDPLNEIRQTDNNFQQQF